MKMQSIAITVTIINLVILSVLLTRLNPAIGQQNDENTNKVLRARGLEIVDSLGRIRASITIQPPVEFNGVKYSETVLLRLIESHGKPMVKLGGTEEGGGLTIIDTTDQGLIIHAQQSGSYIKLTNKGKERVIHP
jgi:hypothetical protein